MSTGAEATPAAPPQAWTLDNLAAGLERCRQNGSLVLTATTLAQEVDDLLGAVGLTELALDGPQLERTDERISVSGTATLFGVPAVGGRATFVIADGALSVALTAAFSDETRIQILGLPWASIGKLALALNVTGPSLPVPVVTVVLSGAIELEGQPKPIEVTLTPSVGGSDWLLRATDIPLPDLSALAALLPGQDAAALTPPKLDAAGGFEIVELSCGFDPTDWTVHSLAATVGAPGKEWEFAAGLPKLRDVFLGVGLEFESGTEGEDGDVVFGDEGNGAGATTSTGGVKSVSVSAGAIVTLGSLVDLPVRITRQPDEWRVGILGAHGFPSLGELVATAADPDTAALLPAGLHDLKMDSATLELTLGSGDPTLRSIFFSTQLADHWPIVEGYLELEHVALQLFVDRAGGETSGFFAGAIRLGDVELPVAVEKPGGSAPWTLALGSNARPTLSGLSALSGVVGGGDIANHLPAGFGDGALTLRDLSMAFDPETHSVSSIAVEVQSEGPWSLPELTNFAVRDLTLKLHVTAPGDAAKREVTGTISGTVDLAGPAITISASKPTGTAPWQLEGTLAPGPPLNLTALSQRVLQGPSVLPAEVPDLVLSTADLTLTPSTGAVALKLASDGPWHIPIGVTGVEVGGLRIDLQRAASGADVTGSLAGHVGIAGSGFDIVYTLPGDLVLSGHFDSVPLSGLAGDLLGKGFVEALPAPFNALELKNLDVTVAPTQGRFAASAQVPGFDAAAFLVERSSQGNWGFALALAPAASWRLSSISSSLSALDGLSFGNTVLIVSTAADGASIAQLPVVRDRLKTAGTLAVSQGVTLVADLSLDGTGANHVLGMDELRVRASIESVDKLTLEAVLAGPFPLGKTAVLQEVDFRLAVGGSSGFQLGLFGQIDVTLDASNKLVFTGGVAVTPDELKCAVTMDGTWKEPFGAKGVSVSDVALELDWSFVDELPGVGIAGRMEIGDFHGAVAVKFDAADPSQSMVAVSFDSLKLGDILSSLCHDVFGDAIPPELVKTVFDISFKDVEIYVVPRDTTIGTHKYTQGTRLSARMFFWGIEADAHVEIDYAKGLVVDGQVDPIVLGDVFTLKGAGTEPKPKLHLEVTTGKVPTIDMEGQVSLLGLTSETILKLSDTGFEFETTGKIFDLFTCTLEARGGHLGDTNGFFVEATMQNDLFEYLRVHAEAALQQAAKDADAGIASAENDVRDAQAKVGDLQQQIDARRREIAAEREDTRRTLVTSETATVQTKQQLVADLNRQINELYASIQADRARDTQHLVDAQRDVQTAQSQVDTLLGQINRMRVVVQAERDQGTRQLVDAQANVAAAQRNVDSILGDIRGNESWWNSLPDIDWPTNASKTRDAVWYYPKIGGLYTAYGTATAALKVAQGVLEAAKAVQTLPPIDMDPRISGLFAQYGLATAALQTGQGILEAAKAIQTAPPIDADPRLVGLYAERETARAALDTAVTALGLIQSAGDAIPVDMDPEIVGLQAAMATAQLGLQAAQGILEGARVTVAGTLEVSQYIVHYGLGGLIDVRKASFAAGLDAVHGGEVRLSADLEFLGSPQHVEFDFNFTDPLSSVENLVKELVGETSAAAA